jgi:AcrR family transcriptional regulator
MLYAYFCSKEGLYVAYVDRTGRELLDRLAGATTPDDQPSVRLRAGILEFLAFIEEHRDGWQVLFGELTSMGPVVEEVAVLRRRIAEWIMAVLAGTTGAQGPRPTCRCRRPPTRSWARANHGELVAGAPGRAARPVADWRRRVGREVARASRGASGFL